MNAFLPIPASGMPACPVRFHAGHRPKATAVVQGGMSVSYARLDRLVEGTAAALRQAGVDPGARVALCFPRGLDYLVLLVALLRTGAVAVPLSTRLPGDAVRAAVRSVGARWLVTTAALSLEEGRVLAPGDLVCPARVGRVTRPKPLAGVPDAVLDVERPATVVFTSGSTGRPRAAVHAFRQHYFSALGSQANLPLAPGDRWLLSLPLYHVGGLAIVFRCLLAGATVVLPARDEPMGEALRKYDVTHVSMVATQLYRLLRETTATHRALPPSLRAVLLGGGPASSALIDEALNREVPLHTSYGLTEMASQVTTTPPGAPPDKLRTAGRVLPWREVKIDPGGEILVRGATRFDGYLVEAGIEPAFDGDGWFHTGDLGRLDDDGYLHVIGRKDNMFISGGENIHPEEIEAALHELEGVRRAVVVPVPDAEFGARPVAFVDGETGRIPRWRERLAERLPRFKLPVAFYAWPEHAPVAGFKVNRPAFRRLAEELHAERGPAPPGV